jgi:hypothetical protein
MLALDVADPAVATQPLRILCESCASCGRPSSLDSGSTSLPSINPCQQDPYEDKGIDHEQGDAVPGKSCRPAFFHPRSDHRCLCLEW